MYRKIQIFIGVLLFVFLIYPQQSFSEIKYTELSNGIKVIIKEDRRNKVVSVQTWIKGGSSVENSSNFGISHIIEHMLFKGTKNMTGEQINKLIKSKGGYFNAATSYDYTKYYIVMPSYYYKTALKVESDILKNTLIKEDELKSEINVVLEERKRRIDDPSSYLWVKYMENNKKNYPYKNPIIGYKKSIESINKKKIIDYIKEKYNGENIYIIVVGDVNSNEVIKEIKTLFGDISRGIKEKRIEYKYKENNKFNYAQIKNAQTRNYVLMGYGIPEITHNDNYALEVLAEIIGRGISSRLYQELLSKEVLVDYISAGVFSGQYPGYLLISGRVSPEKTKKCINKIYEVINCICKQGVSTEEIKTAISKIETNYVESKEDYSEEGDILGYYSLIKDYKYAEDYIENIRNVKKEDVNYVAKKYLNLLNCNLVISYPKHMSNNIMPNKKEILNLFSQNVSSNINISQGYLKKENKNKEYINKTGKKDEKVKIFNLFGGAKLILFLDKALPVVSINTARVGGFIQENKANNGITYIMQKLLLRGNSNMNRKEIEIELEKIGARMSPIYDMNKIGLSCYVLKRNFEKAMKIYFESIFWPKYFNQEIIKAKDEAINEIKGKEDDMEYYAEEKAREMLFSEKHPYHFSLDGTEENIKKITIQDLVKWHNNQYKLKGLVISVSGDVEERALKNLINSYLKKYSNNYYSQYIQLASNDQNVKISSINREREQTTIVYNCLGPAANSKDFYPFKLFNIVMNGLGGRLFQKLREEEGLVYDVHSYLEQSLGTGIYKIIASCDPKNENKVKKKIIDMFNDVKLNGITNEEYNEAKQYYKGILLISIQSNSDKSRSYLNNELFGRGYKNTEVLPLIIENISQKDVENAAKKYINLDKGAWFIVRAENK